MQPARNPAAVYLGRKKNPNKPIAFLEPSNNTVDLFILVHYFCTDILTSSQENAGEAIREQEVFFFPA